MNEKEIKRGFTTFVKAESKGRCFCCNETVRTDNLWVEKDNKLYHFSCYNNMKPSEENE